MARDSLEGINSLLELRENRFQPRYITGAGGAALFTLAIITGLYNRIFYLDFADAWFFYLPVSAGAGLMLGMGFLNYAIEQNAAGVWARKSALSSKDRAHLGSDAESDALRIIWNQSIVRSLWFNNLAFFSVFSALSFYFLRKSIVRSLWFNNLAFFSVFSALSFYFLRNVSLPFNYTWSVLTAAAIAWQMPRILDSKTYVREHDA